MESSEGWLKTIGGYGRREALFGNKFELNYFLCFEGWIENKQRSQEEWTQPKLDTKVILGTGSPGAFLANDLGVFFRSSRSIVIS